MQNNDQGKIRVFQILTETRIGGTERSVLEYVRRISRDDFNVTVGAFIPGGRLPGLLNSINVDFVIFEVKRKYNIFKIFIALLKLYLLLKKRRFHIIHISGFYANMCCRVLGKLSGTPVIITSQWSIDLWRRWYHSLMDRATSILVDSYISNSREAGKILERREHIPPEKIQVIHDGVEVLPLKRSQIMKKYSEYSEGSIAPLIAMIANFRTPKRHEDVIAAARDVLEYNGRVKFAFAGTGTLEQWIKQKVRSYGLDDSFIFMGYVEDVSILLKNSYLLILPSLWEGLPRSLLEAMSNAVPVIATSVGGVPEIVIHGETGILIEPGNPRQLSKSIIYLLSNPDKAAQYGYQGYLRAKKFFRIDSSVELLETLYKNELKKKGYFSGTRC
ncbi:MAG: glycosyltransferase family 4 protein [Fidelibacterota bacterium]